MYAAVLKAHPTDPNTLILDTPPELKFVMGRFEAARYASHFGYLFHVDHLGPMLRFLQLNDVAVMDDRPRSTPGPPQYRHGQEPVFKCPFCDWTQRTDGNCHNCNRSGVRPHFVTADEQTDINRRGMALVQAATRKATQ